MSTIIYKIGSKEFSFNSRIQLKKIPLIAVEENVMEEIRLDIQKRPKSYGKVHDITLLDDNGLIAYAKHTDIGELTKK